MTHPRLASLAAMIAIAAEIACGGSTVNTAAATTAATTAAGAASPAGPVPASSAQAGVTVSGAVAETMNAGGYTYVRLQTANGDVWIAATAFPVKIGERLTAPLESPMQNFHSNTLNRDFATIYFVSQIAREGQALLPATPEPTGAPAPMGSHAAAGAPAEPVERIPPAPGGLSVADVWAKRTALAGKPVIVRGKVVKVNEHILDLNWIHLQDGSGSADARTNDLTVTTATTAASVKVGDIVTASGVLAVGKDFGAGYAYDAMLEQAVLSLK